MSLFVPSTPSVPVRRLVNAIQVTSTPSLAQCKPGTLLQLLVVSLLRSQWLSISEQLLSRPITHVPDCNVCSCTPRQQHPSAPSSAVSARCASARPSALVASLFLGPSLLCLPKLVGATAALGLFPLHTSRPACAQYGARQTGAFDGQLLFCFVCARHSQAFTHPSQHSRVTHALSWHKQELLASYFQDAAAAAAAAAPAA